MNDVLLNKVAIIERCLMRVKEEYADNYMNLQNYTKQDSIILNLQRTIEATIDIAMHIVAKEKWGLPQNSRDAFQLLYDREVISEFVLARLSAMIGFRNIVVQNYQEISLQILQKIVENHLEDFLLFIQMIKRWI